MNKVNIEDAVKRFQKQWNEYEYSRLIEKLRFYESKMIPYGIVNFNDETLHQKGARGKHYDGVDKDFEDMLKYQQLRIFKDAIKAYDNDSEPIKFKLKQKQKYGDLYLGRPPHSWEAKTGDSMIWRKWASVDLGSTDYDRRGGLMKYGGYGRAEPKKYLRGHLYPETIIKEGWVPKKQKDKVGKSYGNPLQGAKSSDGSLSQYGPEYYI